MDRIVRSIIQIQDDCVSIQRAAKTAKTWGDIEKSTGLSYFIIRSTLSSNPSLEREICEMLDKNAQCSEKGSAITQSVRDMNSIAKPKMEDTGAENVKSFIKSQMQKSVLDELEAEKVYVIDTSVTNFEKIDELFFRIIHLGSRIIITSIVNDELENLAKGFEDDSYRARLILRWAASMPEIFVAVQIARDEGKNADDCIIEYCQTNTENIVLLTADKHMAIDARSKGVSAIYMLGLESFQNELKSTGEKLKQVEKNEKKSSDTVTKRLIKLPQNKSFGSMPKFTLSVADYKNGVLSIKSDRFKSFAQMVVVEYIDKLYWKGPIQLSEGMGVYIIKRVSEKIFFEYYIVTSITFANNCVRLFSDMIDAGMEFEDKMCNEALQKAKSWFKLFRYSI